MERSAQVVPFGRRTERRTRPPLLERLAAIISVQSDILASDLDLTQVLYTVAVKVERLTAADGGVVELLEERGQSLVYAAATGHAAAHRGQRMAVNGSLSGLCVTRREVLRCDDSETDPRVSRELCRKLGVRSLLVVPLFDGGETIGALKVMGAEPDAFDDSDVHSLQLCAPLISTAIARAAKLQSERALMAEREQATQDALERNALLHAMFESAPMFIAVTERVGDDLRYLSVSAALAAAHGRSPALMAGLRVSELGASPEALRTELSVYDEAALTKQPVHYELTTGDAASAKTFAATVCAIPGPTARFVFIAQDITHQKSVREQSQLNERMASLGRLAAGVAHEANNPLAYTVSNVNFARDLLREHKPLTDEDRADLIAALTEAGEGAERVKLIIRDLNTFARSDDSVGEPVSLEQVVDRAIAMCGHVLAPLTAVERRAQPTPVIQGNAARLGQVVMNLLVNAAQAMPAGRPVNCNSVQVTTATLEDGRPYVEVRDNAGGMAPEIAAKIFEPFFTTKPVGKGMGLGLSICHKIMRSHGGDLTVSSRPNEGSVFRMVFGVGSP